ncbi:MAG: PilZ domain-containing protein [Planctomycetota bacterium]|nr:PilZ domain-containing protein [Planctomycetota bacterium]
MPTRSHIPASGTSAGKPSDLRKFGRLRCQDVQCSLGTVTDLSRGGMRVRMARKPPPVGAPFTVRLFAMGHEIYLNCSVCWSRSSGLWRYELGVAFDQVADNAKSVLAELARSCAYNETVRYVAPETEPR